MRWVAIRGTEKKAKIVGERRGREREMVSSIRLNRLAFNANSTDARAISGGFLCVVCCFPSLSLPLTMCVCGCGDKCDSALIEFDPLASLSYTCFGEGRERKNSAA